MGDASGIAPPLSDGCLAVIFTSLQTDDVAGYGETAARMDELARQQPGFLGVESAHTPGGVGITVSYWEDEAAIAAWKRVAEHVAAQQEGRDRWYADYALRVVRVERSYSLATSPREGLAR